MKNTYKILVAALLLMTVTFNVTAQNNFPVNLEAVLKLAGANNLTIQEYELKYQEALAENSKAREWWLPDIYAGASTHYLDGAAMNTDGNILTNVSRNNLWAGLGITADIDFSKGFYQSLATKQKSEVANYLTKAARNIAILKAVQTYFDLQMEQLKFVFLQSLVDQADTLSQQIKIKVDAGLLYQSDYLMSLSNYNHIKISMLQAKMEWQKKSAELTNLLNLENTLSLVSADTTIIAVPFNMPQTDTNGFEKRAEYIALNSELQSFMTLRKGANQGLLMPKLSIGFNNGAFGAYTSPLYNTYQFNVSLLWNLPLGRLTYKGDLKKADTKILIQQNEIEQFRNQYQEEISVVKAQLQIAGEQMELAESALKSSAEAMTQSIERQFLGTAMPFEVFQAQQFYLQARLDYLKAVSEYNKSQFTMIVASGEEL
jgi:outer membrane protein TolC